MEWWLLVGLLWIVFYTVNVLLLGQLREQSSRQRYLLDRISLLLERLNDATGLSRGGAEGHMGSRGENAGDYRRIF